MIYKFLKKLVEGGDGEYEFFRIGAIGEEALALKRDFYLAACFEDATEDEWKSQFKSETEPAPIVAEDSTAMPEPEVVPIETPVETPVEVPATQEGPAPEVQAG
jgi:hypothetical protein